MEPGNPNQLLLRIFLPGPPIANQSSGQSPIDHTRCRVKEDKGIQGLRTEIAWSDEQPSASRGGVVVIRDNNLVDAWRLDKWKPHLRASVRVEDGFEH